MNKIYTLLPSPKQITWHNESFKANKNSYIFLSGNITKELLNAGKNVQDTLIDILGHLEIIAGGRDQSPRIIISQDPKVIVHKEGYRLTIRPDEIQIIGADAAGVFYATQTLKQIARQSSGTESLPCVDILDWPDYKNRGVSADISRSRVPTMAYLYGLIDMLSEWKINQFSLHMENTFAYRKHRRVWENASPMTGEEILLLDRYCQDRFIELVPYQNCFGHMETWLQYEEYQYLAEVPFDWQLPDEEFDHSPSLSKYCRATMNPKDPRTFKFVDELLSELLPHFSSNQVYLAMDEPSDLGKGHSKKLCDDKGFVRVYFEYIRDIAKIVEKHGSVLQFWGFPVRKNPEWAKELPQGSLAHIWPYTESDSLVGTGMPFYIGTYASGVLSIAGTLDYSTKVVSKGIESGLKHGADGVWTYEYGDEGHWHTPPITLIAYAHSASLSWAYEVNRKKSLPDILNTHVFMDRSNITGKVACDLGNVYHHPGLNSSITESLTYQLGTDPLWDILQGAIGITQAGDRWTDTWNILFRGDQPLSIDGLEETTHHINEIISPLSNVDMSRPDASIIVDELKLGASLQKHACKLAQALIVTNNKRVDEITPKSRRKLADELGPLIEEHRHLWLQRSRPGGLDHSAGLLERLFNAYI